MGEARKRISMNVSEVDSQGIGTEFGGEQEEPPLRVTQVDFHGDPRWLEFLSTHPDALIYHHPGYLAALESEYGRRCVALACEGPDGRLQAILPLLPTRGLPVQLSRNQVGKRLSSLPRTPLAGPLASNRRALQAVLEGAVNLVQSGEHGQLEIKTTIPELDRLVPALHCIRWRDTYTRGLPNNEILRSELPFSRAQEADTQESSETVCPLSFGTSRENHKIRWAIKKATDLGVSFRPAKDEADVRAWYRLYLEAMRRNVVLPRPYRFFRQLSHQLGSHGNGNGNGTCNYFSLYLAEVPNEHRSRTRKSRRSKSDIQGPAGPMLDLVSGSILLQYGGKVLWAFTGSNKQGMQSHANDLVIWQCLSMSNRQRYQSFDLGEVAEDHPELARFKAKWGAIRTPMYRYYFPAPFQSVEQETEAGSGLMKRVVGSVWQRMPLPVVAACGDLLNSFL